MITKLENKISLALPEEGMVIIGLSGGADSLALTHFVSTKIDKNRILCAHVNHMLRGREADRDEAVSASFCEEHGLRFDVLRADVKELAKERKIGTEECGRQVRYEYFASLIESENDVILTAHNADDNAETMVMNLVKGAGITGMSGIPYRRGRIVRPLINVTRKDIENYCKEQGISYVTDSSNLGDDYERNRVRHHVIPELLKINPSFIENIYSQASLFRKQDEFIKKEAVKLLEKAENDFGLDVNILLKADEILASTALKIYFEENGCDRLSKENLKLVMQNLRNGCKVDIPGAQRVECSGNTLTVTCIDKKEEWSLLIKEGENLLPNGKTLHMEQKTIESAGNSKKVNNLLFNYVVDYDTITEDLLSRSRKDGDKFAPAGRKLTKKLKQIFKDMKIPAAVRDDIVIVESAGDIVFVEGVGVSEKHKIKNETEKVVVFTISF